MLNKLKSILKWGPEELNEVKTPQRVDVAFLLTLNNIEVGTLSLHNGQWAFKYSDTFKNQSSLMPIMNFPNKDKEYFSLQLWPFFVSRIPGPGQPIVKDFLLKEGIEKADEVTLLKKFGKRTISNPYVLESA